MSEKGSVVEVYGINIPIPPPPAKSKIAGYHLPKKSQKWQRNPLPKDWQSLSETEQDEFITREWDRRINGYWFYNNGEPTYIPGGYYFELNWWQIDSGYKDYRDRDRRKWLFWDYCDRDPSCYGCIYMKHRRDGATYWATAINYEKTTRSEQRLSGIQSKTDADAKSVFGKLIAGWRRLPDFFRPLHDGTTHPKSDLRFFEPAKGGHHKQIKATTALDSSIEYRATVDTAFDGEKLLFYHGDEWGKIVKMNVMECWRIVKQTLSLGSGKIIVGKALITSTVAEMEKKGGKHFRELWKQSNPHDRNKNNQTTSGLYRLFIPADDGLEGFIDEYGMSLKEQARQHILNEREDLKAKGDLDGYREHKRLFPLTEEDALASDGRNCLFDVENIDAALESIEANPHLVQNGILRWKDGKPFSSVEWIPQSNGRWLSHYLPDKKEANRVKKVGDKYFPDNKEQYSGGIDPFDHKTTTDNRRSSGAGVFFRKYDELIDGGKHPSLWLTYTGALEYVYRPATPEMFYMDMLLTAWYLGCEVFVETNKPGLWNWFDNQGCKAFLMLRPESTQTANTRAQKDAPGAPASPMLHEHMADRIETFCATDPETEWAHVRRFPFKRTLEDWKDLDLNDTTKFDAGMAGGYGLIAIHKRVAAKPKPIAVTQYVKRFDNSGIQSKIIR
jgi:hypothetical protein